MSISNHLSKGVAACLGFHSQNNWSSSSGGSNDDIFGSSDSDILETIGKTEFIKFLYDDSSMLFEFEKVLYT